MKNPWRVSDGLAFVGELDAGATPVAYDDRGWETLLHARKRTQVSLANLIAVIRDGLFVVGKRAGAPGMHGLVLRKTDVDTLPVDPSVKRNVSSEADFDIPAKL